MDWSRCELVEVIPGKVSGAPLIVGTRIPADLVLDLVDSGCETSEILEDYPALTAEILMQVSAYAHGNHMRRAS